MKIFPVRPRMVSILGAALVVVAIGYNLQHAQAQSPELTPGMLFGPVFVEYGQQLDVCSAYLSDGELTQFVHFRNLTTGEVTKPEQIIISAGKGACATYKGRGLVVGMARGELPAAEWVSPSNALIGTMSLIDPRDGVKVTVLGVAKFWLKGL